MAKEKKKFNVSIPFLNGPHSPTAAAAARTFFPSDFKQSETNSSAALFFCGFPFLSACRTHAAFLHGSLFMATASFSALFPSNDDFRKQRLNIFVFLLVGSKNKRTAAFGWTGTTECGFELFKKKTKKNKK